MKSHRLFLVVLPLMGFFVFSAQSINAQTKPKVAVIPMFYEKSAQTVTKYYSVPPTAFNADSGDNYENFLGFYDSHATVTSLLSTKRLVAPAHLPHGAGLKRFTVYYKDDQTQGGGAEVNFWCGLYGLSRNGGWLSLANVNCTELWSGDTYVSTSAVTQAHTVNNANYSYQIECWDIGGAQGEYLQSALIEYTVVE